MQLDIGLAEGTAYPLVEDLLSKGTGAVFMSGMRQDLIPGCYRAIPFFAKPCAISSIRDVVV